VTPGSLSRGGRFFGDLWDYCGFDAPLPIVGPEWPVTGVPFEHGWVNVRHRRIFRSTDGGKTWTRVQTVPVAAIEIDPRDPTVVYVGVPSGGRGIIRYTFDTQSTAVQQSSWAEVKKRSSE
jgi:hypothetical protein